MPAKFQKDRLKSVGGVVHTRYVQRETEERKREYHIAFLQNVGTKKKKKSKKKKKKYPPLKTIATERKICFWFTSNLDFVQTLFVWINVIIDCHVHSSNINQIFSNFEKRYEKYSVWEWDNMLWDSYREQLVGPPKAHFDFIGHTWNNKGNFGVCRL